MHFKDEIKGLYEPRLVEIFEQLNTKIFNDELIMPEALCYDYRRVGSKRRSGRGGQILYNKDGSRCYYIVVRGKQKGNRTFETLTILHEMVHLSLSQQFCDSNLRDNNFSIKDFTGDKTATFILECAKIAKLFGCSYDELKQWSIEDSPDNRTTMTSKRYNEVQAAKALLA